MNALCPDLDAESQDMDRIPLLHQYYVPFLVSAARDCEHYIDQKKLEDLVNCIIRMNESGVPGDISKISRDVLAVCVQCELLDLARILVEGIHKKRMLQFWKEKKSIDVSEDLGAYLGYCIVPEPEPRAPILSTEDLIQILKEHKTRAPVAGIPSFHEILDVFVKEVRRIHEGGRSSPALFHRISVISQFLLSEEPISQQVIQLIYYAFQCPWTDYCFHTFLNLSRALQLKMEEQKLTSSNVPGAPYFITNENAISRIVHNFHETDFKVGSELVSFTVREFILFFYSLYRKTSDPKSYIFFRGILIQALQKIVKEKPSWAASCILDLLSRFREDVFTFQGFIRDLDVPQSAKNGLMVSLGL
jgi:hypothetical protein